jgi:2-oxoisovalerate dehydrogenase E1 component
MTILYPTIGTELFVWHGVTPMKCFARPDGNTGDTASHGRQMPVHFGNKKLNILSNHLVLVPNFFMPLVWRGGYLLESLAKGK